MKLRYTITVAGYEMNVLSDDHPEEINEIVSALDRSIRTLCSRNRNLPMMEATMLAALDACGERRKAQIRIHELEHELYDGDGEAAKLRRENQLLRAYINRHKLGAPDPVSDSDIGSAAEETSADVTTGTDTAEDGKSSASENSADDSALDEIELLLRRRLSDGE